MRSNNDYNGHCLQSSIFVLHLYQEISAGQYRSNFVYRYWYRRYFLSFGIDRGTAGHFLPIRVAYIHERHFLWKNFYETYAISLTGSQKIMVYFDQILLLTCLARPI